VASKKKTTRAKPGSAPALIKRCQRLWTTYCNRPTKANLLKVKAHLDKMAQSDAKTVKAERRKCLRVFNAEWKDKGYKAPAKKKASRRKNPSRQRGGFYIVDTRVGKVAAGPYSVREADMTLEQSAGFDHDTHQVIDERYLSDLAFRAGNPPEKISKKADFERVFVREVMPGFRADQYADAWRETILERIGYGTLSTSASGWRVPKNWDALAKKYALKRARAVRAQG
jgi:hypothetical protein